MGLIDRARSWITRAPKTQPVIDGASGIMSMSGMRSLTPRPREDAAQLRRWARTNEFLAMAIARRKHQVGMASWKLVRRDKPNQPAVPAVESAVRDLLDMPNPTGESFRSFLDKVLDDLLILDAGCIEKELTLGGKLLHLWPVNGATVRVLPDWDGSDLSAPRYVQALPGMQKPIELRNDQLIYMMSNPSTHTVEGWSPVQTLLRVVRAELFGEDYNYEQIRRHAPRGLLQLPLANPRELETFKTYFRDEVEGMEALGIIGGSKSGDAGGEAKYISLVADDFEKRLSYQKWLATKIAGVFEMDLQVFNLSETVQKSVGKQLTARTDEGAESLATMVAEYITREIVWVIDPTRSHAFSFDNLNDRDALAQAKVDQINMSIGVTFPNEIRARDGKDPVEWGDEPYSSTQSQFAGDDPESGDPQDGNDEEPGENATGKRFAKSKRPFVGV